jgi:hypothetical protein
MEKYSSLINTIPLESGDVWYFLIWTAAQKAFRCMHMHKMQLHRKWMLNNALYRRRINFNLQLGYRAQPLSHRDGKKKELQGESLVLHRSAPLVIFKKKRIHQDFVDNSWSCQKRQKSGPTISDTLSF